MQGNALDCSPPGTVPIVACLLLLIGQLIGSPASTESGRPNFFACALSSSCTSRRTPRSRELSGADWQWVWPTELVATAT